MTILLKLVLFDQIIYKSPKVAKIFIFLKFLKCFFQVCEEVKVWLAIHRYEYYHVCNTHVCGVIQVRNTQTGVMSSESI